MIRTPRNPKAGDPKVERAFSFLLAALLACFMLASVPVLAQERGFFKEGESAENVPEDIQTDQLGFVFQEIARATNQGLDQLIPILNGLLATLLIISLILTFIFGAFQEDFSPFAVLLKKALIVGFILYFISEWEGIRAALLSGAGQIGLIAGNSDLDAGSVLNPANVAGRGFSLALAVLTRIIDLSGPIAFFYNLLAILIYVIAGFIILIAFLILSIVVFVALVEFYVGTTVAVILFPLGVLRATSFAASSAFGYVLASAVKIAVLGLIVGLATSVFIDPLLDREPDPLQGEALGIAFISLAIAVVAWSASSVAAGLVQGGPTLGAGSAIGPAVSAAVGGVLAARGGAAALRAPGARTGGGGGAVGGGASPRPALPGGGGTPALGRSSPAAALPRPNVAGLLPPPGGSGAAASSTSGSAPPAGGGGGAAAALPVPAGQALPAVAGQSPPAVAGQALPANFQGMAAGPGGAGSASGAPGGDPPRASMTKPAPPPAGEGKGGRGGIDWRQAAAYGATQGFMQDRGGGGYRGPDLERD